MRISVARKLFEEALSSSGMVVSKSSPRVSIQCVLIECEDSCMTITGTNLNYWVEKTIPAECENGSFLVQHDRLLAAVRSIKSGDVVTLEYDNDLQLLKVKCGKAKWEFACVDPSEFPRPKRINDEGVFVLSSEYRNAIKKTAFAAEIETTQYALQAVAHFADHFGVSLVATDGRRLSKCFATCGWKTESQVPVLVPASVMKTIEKISASIDGSDLICVSFDASTVCFSFASTKVTSRTQEGKFPQNWSLILPGSDPIAKVSVPADELKASLDATRVTTDKLSSAVDFTVGEHIEISSKDETGSSAIALTCDVEWQVEKTPFVIRVSPSYMSDIASVFPGEMIEIAFYGSDKQVVVNGANGFVGVVMPLG